MSDQQATDDTAPEPLPPPPTVLAEHTRLLDPPRAGELSTGWRVVTACLWISVIVAFAAVWSSSAQLGLSTWWLGPRADPRSPIIRLSPFVAPLLMTIATFNNMRRLPWFGIGASLVTAAFGIGDLGRVTGLAVLELIIAGLALVVSAASLTGVYRAGPGAPAADVGDEPVR
ncbi:MAG: hypothetical protein CL424_03600 [Acidimicrobiaceae bacterium]|nr:hypothetical protein [Acidimicrobiaceae bacterium]